MGSGLETTFAILARSKTAAADDILRSALDSSDRGVQLGALRAMLDRRSLVGQRELLRRWPTFSERWKSMISERPGCIAVAVREAVLSSDAETRASACDAVVHTREYDLIPMFLSAAEGKSDSQAELAAKTLLALSELLYEELATPRDYRRRRDPQTVRRFVVSAMEHSVQHFDRHRRSEIVEAFLLLANRENAVLKRILLDTRDRAHPVMVRLLTQSSRLGVVRLLLNYLDDPHMPAAVQESLMHRRDIFFVRHFLRRIDEDPSLIVRSNLKRLDSFAWLADGLGVLSALNDREQSAAIQVVLASGMSRIQALGVVRCVLERGGHLARAAATAALANFKGYEANELLMKALEDKEQDVKAIALGQVRSRGIPNALAILSAFIDSPDDVVRQAARAGLSEFRFRRFFDSFDLLDEVTRRETGRIVKRVDENATHELAEELNSPTRARRQRAVAAAVAMDAVGDLEKEFLRLLTEDDLFVRAEVIRALAHTDSDEVREALHNVLLDPSMVLQDAAMETLQSLAEREGRVAPIPAIVAERADGTTPQPADYVMEVGP